MIATLLAVAAAASGCSGGSAEVGSDPNNPDQVEVMTWWTSGSDRAGFRKLLDIFTEQNPRIQFIDASVSGSGGEESRLAIAARLDAGNPPDSFQTTAGAGLAGYVREGRVQDLTGWYAQNDLDAGVFRADLLDLLRVNGKLYSVPLDINRVNVLWANTDLLSRADIDPKAAPPTIDAWIADLEKLRQSGIRYPLALGTGWTQTQLFENVLLADMGPVLYKNLWVNTTNWSSDRVRAAIDHYAELLTYVDPLSGSWEWDDATDKVVDGESGYIVMADFALVVFQREDYTYGDEYVSFAVPGTEGVFDFLTDSFTLPTGAVHDTSAKLWLRTLATTEAQKVFTLTKGSIPARLDAADKSYPPYQQDAIASLRVDTVVPSLAHGVAADSEWTSGITDALVRFRSSPRPEALQNALADLAFEHLAGG